MADVTVEIDIFYHVIINSIDHSRTLWEELKIYLTNQKVCMNYLLKKIKANEEMLNGLTNLAQVKHEAINHNLPLTTIAALEQNLMQAIPPIADGA